MIETDFERSGTAIETNEIVEELNFAHEYEDGAKIILDELIKK